MATSAQKVYALSLFELCLSESCETPVLEELKGLHEIIRLTPELIEVLSSPLVVSEEKLALLDSVFSGKLSELVLNTLKLMTVWHRVHCIDGVIKDYEELYNTHYNISYAEVTTAVELSDAQLSLVKDKLSAMFSKTVICTNSVNPAVLGGFIVKIDKKELDFSVKSKLECLAKVINS